MNSKTLQSPCSHCVEPKQALERGGLGQLKAHLNNAPIGISAQGCCYPFLYQLISAILERLRESDTMYFKCGIACLDKIFPITSEVGEFQRKSTFLRALRDSPPHSKPNLCFVFEKLLPSISESFSSHYDTLEPDQREEVVQVLAWAHDMSPHPGMLRRTRNKYLCRLTKEMPSIADEVSALKAKDIVPWSLEPSAATIIAQRTPSDLEACQPEKSSAPEGLETETIVVRRRRWGMTGSVWYLWNAVVRYCRRYIMWRF